MANKPEIKQTKKKEGMVEKRRKTTKKQTTTTLSEKKEEAKNVSEQGDKGWIHVIHVHYTIHSTDNNNNQKEN